MNKADTGRVKKSVRGLMLVATVATLLMAACTQDETVSDGNALPEGAYPLKIASVGMSATGNQRPWGAKAPQTRVSESADGMSSSWQEGDKIKVQIGEGTPGTYTYQGGNLIVAEGDAPAYWASADDNQSIRAWHTSSSSETTVNLSNQTNGLAYVLTTQTTANFNKSVSLEFSHALAKVRVVLEGDKKGDVTDVKIKSYTSCTNTQGSVSTEGASEDWITMKSCIYNGTKCWEANVVPDHPITKFQVNETDGKLNDNGITPLAAKVNTITLTVGAKVINISDITGTEYTISGNVYLKGDGKEHPLKLKLTEGTNLTLENVKLKPSEIGNVVTCDGDATINLKGDNAITSSSTSNSNNYRGSGIFITQGTLTINGDSNAKLNVTGSGPYGGAGIGASNNADIIINGGNIEAISIAKLNYSGQAAIGSAGYRSTCGNIIINGGTIKATGGDDSPGIGASPGGACGNIEINGGNVSAYGKNIAGGIGSAWDGKCGTITIKGTGTTVYAQKGTTATVSIGKGSSDCADCGTVTIGKECTVTQK